MSLGKLALRCLAIIFIFAGARLSGVTLLSTSLVANPQGAYPYRSTLLEVDGIFYGETQRGGLYGNGTVFKITPDGTLTVLVSFNVTNGKQPSGGLILGSDGDLYGTTATGGPSGFGTVFRVSLSGTLTTLCSFNDTDGANPLSGVIQGKDGNFYGTTYEGNFYGTGEVFEVTAGGTLSVIGTFEGSTSSGIIQGADGNFYGVTDASLTNGGVVFQLTPNKSFTQLFTFSSSFQGSNPIGRLTQDSAGNLYGMTEYGGSSNLANGGGTIFELTGSGTTYTFKTLASFITSNGALPTGDLYRDTAGNFFGTTSSGGSSNQGTAFELSPSGSAYTLSTLATFTTTNGAAPMSGLVVDGAGNLYGTTAQGGDGNAGTVFEITGNNLTTLATFPSFGTTPYGGLVQGPDGNFYGTANSAGNLGYGTVFEFVLGSNPQTLVTFDDTNGANPQAGLMMATDGNFYGTTIEGGANENGTVFKFSYLSPTTSFNTVVDFNNSNGSDPSAALIQGSDGNLYGSTLYGGAQGGYGTVFQILLNSPSSPTLNTIYSFNGTDGWNPKAPLLQGSDGNLYGTTTGGGTGTPAPTGGGIVFELTLDGELTDLVNFDESFGVLPEAQLTEDAEGNLYGTTRGFGTGVPNSGTIYKLAPGSSGYTYSTLVTLGSGQASGQGAEPEAGLFLNSDGNFYGTTSGGGVSGLGTVYKVTAGGTITTLIDFDGSNGSGPSCTLIKASDGNFYGTTQTGGTADTGTVFCLEPGDESNFAVNSAGTIPVTTSIYSIEGSELNLTLGFAPTPGTVLTLIHDTQGPIIGTFSNLSNGGKITSYYQGVAYTFIADYTGNGGDDLVLSLGQSVLPSVSSEKATDLTASSAALSAMVNPNGSGATGAFQYGLTTDYGITTLGVSAGAGSKNVSVSTTVSGLSPSTEYHYRAIGTNEEGTVYGQDKTFTTLPTPQFGAIAFYPSASGVELSAAVNPVGVSTSVYFTYGTSSGDFTGQTDSQSIGSGKASTSVFSFLPDLEPGASYYFEVMTTSSAGTFYGPTATFTTLPNVTTVAVQQGASVPGIGPGTFSTLGNPALNQNGYVAFMASVSGTTSSQDSGIWADDSTGNLQLEAQAGSSAPGTNGVFNKLSDPVYNENEGVAFWAKLKVSSGQATSSTATGIWSSSSGTLALVAREGFPAPGVTGGVFDSFTSLGITDTAGTVFLAELKTGSGINSTNDLGVWEGNTAADLHLVLGLGATVGGKTITKMVFLSTETYVGGQTRSFTTAGDLALQVTFNDKTTGLVKVVSGVAQLVVVSGTVDTSTGADFSSFGNPAINSSGGLAFEASLLSGNSVTSSNDSGIWADDNGGSRQLVAQTGTSAPGTAAAFTEFSDPVFNDDNAVAFWASLKVAKGEATTSGDEGIWSTGTGQLSLVALKGGAAPGCPAGVSFSSFTDLILQNEGGVAVLAKLNTSTSAGVTDKNKVGIWEEDSNHQLRLLVRTGDSIAGKTITSLSFLPSLGYVSGQSRNFDKMTGSIAYLATFSDKSTEVFVISLH